ncbi:ImmA/IrrE family metallo-endopeptidase [Komagataeibacter rhaeticus]|uniref:ImmA/IrrE family metallo-endopeptidase n=1 Tax=Komagataeibacter rhaeticus TaxID=215221 RepID=UPI000AE41487|nr:hypothetical protein [Komagataeibacter rhaeticus]
MNNDFQLKIDGWLGAGIDDVEARTVTRLRISIFDHLITRNISKRGGGASETINTSLLPLAEFIANGWWALLYEPIRPNISDAFRVRHRLDSGMRGYAFPALALWSGGDDTIVADWATFNNPYATISFTTSAPDEPVQLTRNEVELCLMDLVETVIERLGSSSGNLLEAWNRVRHSIADLDELSYCIAAGHLGLDPYDPDSPDLSVLTAGISKTLFNDISEIVEVPNLADTSSWLKHADTRLKIFPETDLSYFGPPVQDNVGMPAWMAGQEAAELLRIHAGLPVGNPRNTVSDLLGSVISEDNELGKSGPEGISAIVQRFDSTAQIGTVARSARQRRFRACAAAYLAWTSEQEQEHAATDATTRKQQASRAFAAELLAPKQALLERASRIGFDDDDLLELASEFICPYETVKWQAFRAGIPLRGIVIPPSQRERVIIPNV